MAFDEVVREVVERCPGARGAAIIDADGIPVVTVDEDGRLEELAAEYSTVVREIQRAARELDHGELAQVTVEADLLTIILTTIAAGYFLVVLLAAGGLQGKARFLSRLAGARLHSEFI